MQCERCGGDCYDNARKNEERAAKGQKPMPLFACKDKDGCGWVKWPPKGQAAPKPGTAPSRPKWTWPDLIMAYEHCHNHAIRILGKDANPESVGQATSTLMIAAYDHQLPGPHTLKNAKENDGPQTV